MSAWIIAADPRATIGAISGALRATSIQSRVGVDCYNLRGACTDRCERGPSKAELQVTPDACCEDTLKKRVLTVEQVWITKCGRRSGCCLRGKSWAYF